MRARSQASSAPDGRDGEDLEVGQGRRRHLDRLARPGRAVPVHHGALGGRAERSEEQMRVPACVEGRGGDPPGSAASPARTPSPREHVGRRRGQRAVAPARVAVQHHHLVTRPAWPRPGRRALRPPPGVILGDNRLGAKPAVGVARLVERSLVAPASRCRRVWRTKASCGSGTRRVLRRGELELGRPAPHRADGQRQPPVAPGLAGRPVARAHQHHVPVRGSEDGLWPHGGICRSDPARRPARAGPPARIARSAHRPRVPAAAPPGVAHLPVTIVSPSSPPPRRPGSRTREGQRGWASAPDRAAAAACGARASSSAAACAPTTRPLRRADQGHPRPAGEREANRQELAAHLAPDPPQERAAAGGCGGGGVSVSTSTGGGANSWESSTGGVSGTNCSAASLGRKVIVPWNAGSRVAWQRRAVGVVEEPAAAGGEPALVRPGELDPRRRPAPGAAGRKPERLNRAVRLRSARPRARAFTLRRSAKRLDGGPGAGRAGHRRHVHEALRVGERRIRDRQLAPRRRPPAGARSAACGRAGRAAAGRPPAAPRDPRRRRRRPPRAAGRRCPGRAAPCPRPARRAGRPR